VAWLSPRPARAAADGIRLGFRLGLARGEARQRGLEVLGEGVGARVLGQPVEPGEVREQQPVGLGPHQSITLMGTQLRRRVATTSPW
jgi:hypothetical protein